MRFRFIGAVLTVILLLSATAVSKPSAAGENEDFRFAKRLQRDGMHMAAAEEFVRFAEKYPRSILRPDALLGAGESYMQAGKTQEALDVFGLFLESYGDDEDACKARIYRGRIFKALRRYTEAANEFLTVPEQHYECALIDHAFLDAGECLLAGGASEEAVRVLQRLINEQPQSTLVPRARYSMAMALINTGREEEAEAVLSEIVSAHRTSPISALALLKLGERALERGNSGRAAEFYRRVVKEYKEKSLQEKGSLKLVEIYDSTSNTKVLLEEAGRFIRNYPDSEDWNRVYLIAVRAAWELGDSDRALELIEASSAEQAFSDSTGEIRLIKGRIFVLKGRNQEALEELRHLRRDIPRSPFLPQALLLEADLNARLGSPREAARLYHLALFEAASPDETISILTRLADVSLSALRDTIAAIHYWDMIVEEDLNGDAAEDALFRSSAAREKFGDSRGARVGFEMLLTRFPEGRFANEAEIALIRLSMAGTIEREAVARLANAAVSGSGAGARYCNVGAILVGDIGDLDRGIAFLERSLETDLPDSLRAKALYHMGEAYAIKFEAARLTSQSGGDDDRGKALSAWLETAQEFAGTSWGEQAHKGYLELKLPEINSRERLARLDEFLRYYGGGGERYWAHSKKVDYLYELAQRGESWAVDSALAVSRVVLGEAPIEQRREVALKSGYLLRMRGDHAGAAASFKRFVSLYGDDPRTTPVLYDLGETYLMLKDYAKAAEAYERCLARRPSRSLVEKCVIRRGDCLYYMRRFAEAAGAYGDFAERYPESGFAPEALYRKVLALEGAGEYESAAPIIEGLAARPGLGKGLRAKVVRKNAERLVGEGRAAEAIPYLEELLQFERSARSYELLGRAQLEAGSFQDAVKSFSQALRVEGADTCAVLAGMAKAYIRSNDFGKARREIDKLNRLCPASRHIAGVLLLKGKMESESNNCEEAVKTLAAVREKYAGGEEAAQALYYMALCDTKQRAYEAAIAKLNMMLRESPHSAMAPDAYFKLASAQFGAGNLNLAASNFALAAEASRDPEQQYLAWKNLARIYQELEDWQKAATTWQEIAERFPDRDDIVEAFFNLGFSYGQTGRPEMAYEVYRRIPGLRASEEQQGRAHYWAGISLKQQGKYGSAVREFLRVPYLKTGGMWGVTAKLEAADCYERMGEVDQAEKIYRDVLSSHGAGSDWGKLAKKALDRIEEVRGGNRDGS